MRRPLAFALHLPLVLVVSGAACERPGPGAPDAGPEVIEDAGPPRVPDEEPPIVTFLEPEEDCLEGEVTFRFEVKDADAGVAFVSAAFASRDLTLTEEGEGRYAATFDVDSLVTGPHTLFVSATDAENNVSEASRLYGSTRDDEYFEEGALACGEPPPEVIDVEPPVVEILSPSASFPAHASATLAVSARVTDDIGPVTALATLGELEVALSSVATTFSGTLELSAIPEGTHELAVSASDDAGNSASATRMVTVDRTPPLVTILEPLADAQRAAYHDVVGEVSDANDIVLVYLFEVGDDQPLASTTSQSPDGRYGLIYRLPCEDLPRETTFELRAVDRAGNPGSAFVDVSVNDDGCGVEP